MTIGTSVQWTSQSKGYSVTKFGKIVGVIPSMTSPFTVLNGLKWRMAYPITGAPRLEESYIVLVGGKYLYWPRTDQLKPTGEPT